MPLTNDPRPAPIVAELARIEGHWRVLALRTAQQHAPRLREAARRLADALDPAPNQPGAQLPDLGPATALDQLRVTVYDACAAGAVPIERLEELLADLRRGLA